MIRRNLATGRFEICARVRNGITLSMRLQSGATANDPSGGPHKLGFGLRKIFHGPVTLASGERTAERRQGCMFWQTVSRLKIRGERRAAIVELSSDQDPRLFTHKFRASALFDRHDAQGPTLPMFAAASSHSLHTQLHVTRGAPEGGSGWGPAWGAGRPRRNSILRTAC